MDQSRIKTWSRVAGITGVGFLFLGPLKGLQQLAEHNVGYPQTFSVTANDRVQAAARKATGTNDLSGIKKEVVDLEPLFPAIRTVSLTSKYRTCVADIRQKSLRNVEAASEDQGTIEVAVGAQPVADCLGKEFSHIARSSNPASLAFLLLVPFSCGHVVGDLVGSLVNRLAMKRRRPKSGAEDPKLTNA